MKDSAERNERVVPERFRVRIGGVESPEHEFIVCTLNGAYKAAVLAALGYADRYPEGHIITVDVERLDPAELARKDLIDRWEW